MSDETIEKINMLNLKKEYNVTYIGIITLLDDLIERIRNTKDINDYKTYTELFEEIYILFLKGGESSDN